MSDYFRLVAILAIAILGIAGCSDMAKPAAQNPKEDLIADPVAWTNSYFLKEIYASGQITTTEMDLDQDGVNELLVETTAGAGTGGTNHAAFRKVEGGYVLLGTFGGKCCNPLPPDPAGNVRIETYWHLSAREGDVRWLVSRHGEFVEEKVEHYVAADDE